MKIDYCLSEIGLTGKMPIDNPNMRVFESQVHAWDAIHLPINKVLSETTKYEGDVAVVLPKGDMDKAIISWLVNTNFDTFTALKKRFSGNVYWIQDGEAGYWNQQTVTLQLWWYNNVANCDGIICTNETEIPYYKGMFPDKQVSVARACMAYVPAYEKSGDNTPRKDKTIISGPLTREYNGLQQIIIAKRFANEIYIPPMGREKMPQDSWSTADNLDVNYLEYMDWRTWMNELGTYSYAINLPGVTGTASFSMNCAWWGIPCIGDNMADTQRICYPDTSVDYNDIESAVKIADILFTNKEFYTEVSKYAAKTVREEFTQEKFLEMV